MKVQQAIHDETSGPGVIARVASVWGLVGVTSWADFAAFVAALYTLWMFGLSLWKNLGRPFCESRGWIKRKARRKDDPR